MKHLYESTDFFGSNYDKKKSQPEKYFGAWIKFYSDICIKHLLGEDDLLLYLNYCLFYVSFEHFLNNAWDLAFDNEKRGKDFQKEANDYLQVFYEQENYFKPVDGINRMNDFFQKMRLDLKCEIKKIQKDNYTEPDFNLAFSSNNSSKKRSPNDFSTGEKNIIFIPDCLLWFELKEKNKNIILFIDEFDAFLNPIQARRVIVELNKLELKVYFILVSQRSITIAQLNSKFNYLLAEKKKISNSTQGEILKKLLKDTPDLNIYGNKQLYIFTESKPGKIDENLYREITKNLFSKKNAKIEFISIGSKDQVQTVLEHSDKDDFPNNLVGIVDKDNDQNSETEKNHLFTCKNYYSIENVLLSPPVLIQFLDFKNRSKNFQNNELREDYFKEIADKVRNSKSNLKSNWKN